MNAQTAVNFGRFLLGFGFVALIGAWITQVTGNTLFGLSQTHLFADATILSLLGIGMLIDGRLHKERL